MKGLGLTPLFGERRGFMPPQLKTKHLGYQERLVLRLINLYSLELSAFSG